MKKRLLLTTLSVIPLISMSAILSSCIPNDGYTTPGFDISESYNNTFVNNNEFIKGVDVSSYTSVLTNFLYENKIQDSTIADGITKISKYNYDELETKYLKSDNNVSLLEYTNKKLYSYIDENGNRIYENLFKILKEQAGVNSIRLRVWVDPKDENGNYYTSGINSTLESTIWTMKQAIQYGIDDFQINFHYSDFWADPERQFVPKSWSNLNTEQLKEKIYQYTYDSLTQIYQETKVFPSSVQVGNELTKGMLWRSDDSQIFADGYKNTQNTIDYFIEGAKAVNDFETYSKTNLNNSNDIKTVLHLESPYYDNSKNVAKEFFGNQETNKLIDVLGITWYPFWNSNLDVLYDLLVNFYSTFNKEIIIEEYSMPYTQDDTGYIGDLIFKDSPYEGKISVGASSQMVMMNSFLNTISKASPNLKTGFYYWEPAWIRSGYSTWATPEGIKYANKNDYEKYYNNKDGFNWSSLGLFDQNGIMLPHAKVLKNFKRISDDNDVSISLGSQFVKDIINPKADPFSFYNTYIISNTNLLNDVENPIIKTPIKSELIRDFDNVYSDTINVYYNTNKNEYTKDQIIDLIKKTYPRIAYYQINFSDFNKDENGNYSIVLNANEDSFLYTGSVQINIVQNQYISNSIDVTTNELSIKSTDKEWYKKLFEQLLTDTSINQNIGSIIYDALNITGGIEEDKIWLYDNVNNVDRYTDWLLLKTDQLYEYDSNNKLVVDYNYLNQNTFDWKQTLDKNNLVDNQYLYFGIKKQINDIEWNKDGSYKPSTYNLVGKESWLKIDLLIFKFKVKIVA